MKNLQNWKKHFYEFLYFIIPIGSDSIIEHSLTLNAVRNTEIMFKTAKGAGLKRIVHISITNPSLDSPLEYFRGKARLEKSLIESGISYAILRPTVLFLVKRIY